MDYAGKCFVKTFKHVYSFNSSCYGIRDFIALDALLKEFVKYDNVTFEVEISSCPTVVVSRHFNSTLNDSETCTNIKNERCKASSKQVLEESTGDSISYSNSEFGVQNGLYRGESNTVECAPTDISPLDSIERTVTTTSLERFTFPKTNTRAFQLGWLDRFQWLEYSVSRDAAYCFVCRQFDVVGSKELAFKVNGFSNWKRALEKNAGFVKHEQAITRQQIVDDVLSADIPYYTILVDGTKDRTNKEIVSMAVRYVKNGQPVESLLCFETITTFDAETNAELILKTLKKYGLDVLYILSQCYDGANVMRGDHGGIQRIIQDKLGKVIPYVHCFNHRLHLVIIAVIENIEMVRIFFDNIKLIYSFFHRAKIQSLYKGPTILNLVVTRWAGHVRATNVVYENYDEIIETLPQVKSHTSYNFDADDIALSTGILSAMKKPEFVFMLEFMKTFLNTISPADKILQSRDVGFREAVPVIESVMTEIQKLRSLSSFEKMWDKCQPKFDLQARPVREKHILGQTNSMCKCKWRTECRYFLKQSQSIECISAPPVSESPSAPPEIECTSAPPTIECTSAPTAIECTSAPPAIQCISAPPAIECTSASTSIECTSAPPVIECTSVPPAIECITVPPAIECTSAPPAIACTSASPAIECNSAST
ncbi:Zinc finger MYM-type protein 1 [Pseudolycoriella hygida]|uniref:Zinc finger MYM-type protein 1 n=1 Tax=Pseudolycoriella hygida TaxID=35572 RepID=A0A9Q0N733_9DIPT|nr:Zinc finger MYM-type protein 1 [Pseudolycoriella hygida]